MYTVYIYIFFLQKMIDSICLHDSGMLCVYLCVSTHIFRIAVMVTIVTDFIQGDIEISGIYVSSLCKVNYYVIYMQHLRGTIPHLFVLEAANWWHKRSWDR